MLSAICYLPNLFRHSRAAWLRGATLGLGRDAERTLALALEEGPNSDRTTKPFGEDGSVAWGDHETRRVG